MDSRKLKETIYKKLMLLATVFSCAILFSIVIILVFKSSLLLGHQSLTDLLFSSSWNPESGKFGFYPIIMGTFYVTGIAMLISIPVSILSAIYIAEYIRGRVKNIISSFVDVLAGVPSVVYGMCAILVLVPLVRDYIAPWFGVASTGFCVFTAGVTLAIMVFPIIISICVEAFRSVPNGVREASLSVGATKWQMIKHVIFRGASPGVFSAVLLGFGRAFGETMAVAMVVGNLPRTPTSVFSPATTLPSLIASTYGEMMSIPLFDSAIMFAALILLSIVVLFNVLARIILKRMQKRWK